jgi:membrane-associated phospholipid phosphatase
MRKLKLFLLVFFIHPQLQCQHVDINLLRSINGSYNSNGGKVMDVFSESITPVTILAPLSIFSYALLKKDKKQLNKGISLASSELLTSILTTTLKLSFRRDRPFITYPEIQKHSSAGSYSFPSGHTSMAFTIATSLSLLYPKWYVIASSYVWASGVGYSRMYLGVHYPSDVLVGALIGAGSSYLCYKLQNYIQKTTEEKRALGLLY